MFLGFKNIKHNRNQQRWKCKDGLDTVLTVSAIEGKQKMCVSNLNLWDLGNQVKSPVDY
jgi:hypothetical protein